MAAETYGNFDAQVRGRQILGCQGVILGSQSPPDTPVPPQSRRYYFLSQEPPEEAGAGSGQRCQELEQQVRGPGLTWGGVPKIRVCPPVSTRG